MGKLREIKSIAVLFGIMSIVLGIVLVVIPGQTQLIINTIVGVALLVVGLIGIFGFASLKKEVKPQRSDGDFACGDSYFRIVRLVESRCYNIHCRNSNGSVCTRHGN